jgi:hypothetical protein
MQIAAHPLGLAWGFTFLYPLAHFWTVRFGGLVRMFYRWVLDAIQDYWRMLKIRKLETRIRHF